MTSPTNPTAPATSGEGANVHRVNFRRIGLTPNECKFAKSRAAGWNDVMRGVGFRGRYEKWSKLRQMAYERGRFQATLAKSYAAFAAVALGGQPKPLTLWKNNETLHPVLRRTLTEVAAQKVEVETMVAMSPKDRRKRKGVA